jgi:hypothetical protein
MSGATAPRRRNRGGKSAAKLLTKDEAEDREQRARMIGDWLQAEARFLI